jgi:hypothetical protein
MNFPVNQRRAFGASHRKEKRAAAYANRAVAAATDLLSQRLRKFDPAVREIFSRNIALLLENSRAMSAADSYYDALYCIEERGRSLSPGGDRLLVPSLSMYRRVLRLARIRAMAGCRRLQPRPATIRVLEQAVIQRAVLDIIVVCPRSGAPLVRPTMTIAFDVASGMVLGIHVGLDEPSVRATLACLRNAILPKTALLAQDPAELRARGDWPAEGIPEALVLDNAQEFHNEALARAASTLGIKVHYRVGGMSSANRAAERVLRKLSAACRPAVGEVGPTLTELRAQLHRWIVDEYLPAPDPRTQLSPLSR